MKKVYRHIDKAGNEYCFTAKDVVNAVKHLEKLKRIPKRKTRAEMRRLRVDKSSPYGRYGRMWGWGQECGVLLTVGWVDAIFPETEEDV